MLLLSSITCDNVLQCEVVVALHWRHGTMVPLLWGFFYVVWNGCHTFMRPFRFAPSSYEEQDAFISVLLLRGHEDV